MGRANGVVRVMRDGIRVTGDTVCGGPQKRDSSRLLHEWRMMYLNAATIRHGILLATGRCSANS